MYPASRQLIELSVLNRRTLSIFSGEIRKGGSLIKDWNELVIAQTGTYISKQAFNKPIFMFTEFNMNATKLNPGMVAHSLHAESGRKNYPGDQR